MWWFKKKEVKPEPTTEWDLGILNVDDAAVPQDIAVAYARLLKYMKKGDIARVMNTQITLYRQGWHYPTSLTEATEIVEKLYALS